MDSTADIERIASGKSVFYFGNSTNYCTSCEELNPDNEYAVIPFPAAKEGGSRYICGGEGYACGIWKDTQNLEACRACSDRSQALRLEARIKKTPRREKCLLLRTATL